MSCDEYKSKHLGAPIVCQQRVDKFNKNNPVNSKAFKEMRKNQKGENHPFFGRKLPPEHAKHISESLKGENHPMYGKKHTEETKKKMSEKQSGENNPNYGKQHLLGKKHTEETKAKIAVARSKYLGSSGYDKSNRSSIEILCAEMLDSLSLAYREQCDYGRFVYDFLVYCENPFYIEVQGDFWHSNPNVYDVGYLCDTQKSNMTRDKLKLEGSNKDILYLWESDIKERPKLCKELIQDFVRNKRNTTNSYDYIE